MWNNVRQNRRLRISLLGSVLLVVLTSWSILALLPTELRAFRQVQQRPTVVELGLSSGLYRYAILLTPSQFAPLDQRISRFRAGAGGNGEYSDLRGRLRLPLSEEFHNHANVVVVDKCIFYGLCWYVGYIELLRQSEDNLLKNFSFHKHGGYTVLGRTTVPVPHEPRLVKSLSPVSNALEYALPDFARYRGRGEPSSSINESAAIVRYIWSRKPRLGPHDDRTPLGLGPLRRLELLERGDWATQCGDIQHIFVNLAAAAPSIRGVRYVGLLQYHPVFPDLVPHSHAAAEVLTEDGSWVLIDPWFGLMFEHQGKLLGSGDILRMGASERERISVKRLVPDRVSPFDADAFEGTIPQGGYWGYFGTLTYGPDESRLFRHGSTGHKGPAGLGTGSGFRKGVS